MPNPFPGMNPYLENPRHWRGVHLRLIAFLEAALNRALPSGFATYIEERIYIEEWGQSYYPDAMVIQNIPLPATGNGVALLECPTTTSLPFDAPRTLNFGSRTVRERFIVIRTVDSPGELIAVVEILSPTNKQEGEGNAEYCRKQRDILDSDVHFLEIDLLRAGNYTVAPPEEGTRQQLGEFDYIISLHRGDRGKEFDIWPVRVQERLPRICLPLTEDVAAITIDLQAVLNDAYEQSGVERSLHYNEEPQPHLRPDDATWTDHLLRQKGLRTGLINAR
jgi:hypothetical protein